jgi:monovalent cation:H+ antiporter-2, CPA2 family
MQHLDLIFTLTFGLTASLVFGFIALRLRLPPIVGYLAAGILVGPHTPGFVANREIAEQLAEVGVILLMFGVGLHFHLDDLLAVRRIAVPGAVGQISAATALGAMCARGFGWDWPAAIVLGMSLSVASTVVLTRVLSEHDDLQTSSGRIALGWLVVEDLFTVVVLVALPAVMAPDGNAWAAVGTTVLRIAVLGAILQLAGTRVIPGFLAAVARTKSTELFTLAVLVLALGIAFASAELFGASMALGAFLAGMVVGKSEFSYRAASEALPMRDAFAVLFFVSVGMLFEPRQLVEFPGRLVAALLVVLVANPLVALGLTLGLGYGPMVGARIALASAQIGEFSFLLAAMGTQIGVLPAEASGLVVAVSIVSIAINPLLYRLAPRLEAVLSSGRLGRWTAPRQSTPAEAPVEGNRHAIVVGYGLVGRTVTEMLEGAGLTVTIIERNIDTVRALERERRRAIYGDAGRGEILDAAGVQRAVALIVTPPASDDAREMLRAARSRNAEIAILVRSAFASQAPGLLRAGADEVVSGEVEVAQRMLAEITLRGLVAQQGDGESRA